MTEDEAIQYLLHVHASGRTSLRGDELPPEIVARLENDGIVTREWLSVARGETPKSTGYVTHIRLTECRRITATNNT